jgi:ATP-dependent helicase HrpA
VLTGPRKHQRLALERRRSYFGFQLDTEMEQLNGRIPDRLRDEARDLLAGLLVSGDVVHPDAGRLKRAVSELDELWRRSGGTLPDLAPDAVRRRILAQLGQVEGWEDFQRTRVVLDPAALVDQPTRERLAALPDMVRLRGDAAPVDYELQNGEGVARIRLREGQAKRLRLDEVPALDRPVRFAVQRGRHPPLPADTLPELQALLRQVPRHESEERGEARMGRAQGQGRGKGQGGRTRHRRPRGRPGRRR